MTVISMKSVICTNCNHPASLDLNGECGLCRLRQPIEATDAVIRQFGMRYALMIGLAFGALVVGVFWIVAGDK